MQLERTDRVSQNLISDIKREFTNFLQNWEEEGQKKYLVQVEKMFSNSTHLLVVGFSDFNVYNPELAVIIFNEYYKYEPMLNEAFTAFMREYDKNLMHDEAKSSNSEKEEKYEVTFDQGFEGLTSSVRDLKCDHLGKLRSFKGTVTRTSEVRPELVVGVFRCKACGMTSKPIQQQFKYTTPRKCTGVNCDCRQWDLDLGKSEFADYQKVRLQEDPSTIPAGSMPRSIDVILRNDNAEKAQPGDMCKMIGYLCVMPDVASMIKPGEKTQMTSKSTDTRAMSGFETEGITGIKGMRELHYKLIFVATNVKVENNQFQEEIALEDDKDDESVSSKMKKEFNLQSILNRILDKLSEKERQSILQLRDNPNLYEEMAESIFPSIFGHRQIKKALLLQLIGGIHKKTANKISIRGDINILIVGDPSTAKSQFLKCVNKFVPRSVYTNGKTTSAAGLTASVTRDQNGNVAIEAGALMLADNGICCIDEFDKMDIKDQVAIHEAMEQQTISLAKAGVQATLNARTSILAAANPLFGRYDKSKALRNNINLSAPLLSRFDLFFIVCDESNELADNHLSEFLVNMHKNKDQAIQSRLNSKDIKSYISLARKIKPTLTMEAAELLRKYYKEIRLRDKGDRNSSTRVTVRQLESMIRLSEAYARLHLQSDVRAEHVREAYRLLSCSIIKLEKPDIEIEEGEENAEKDVEQKLGNISLMEQQLKQKEREKKLKAVSISHEFYQEVMKNTLKLFKEEQSRHQRREVQEEHQITQEKLIDYLLSINYETGTLDSENQQERMKKILRALIKKMIRQERMLMIIEDSAETDGNVLQMHPNYIEQ